MKFCKFYSTLPDFLKNCDRSNYSAPLPNPYLTDTLYNEGLKRSLMAAGGKRWQQAAKG